MFLGCSPVGRENTSNAFDFCVRDACGQTTEPHDLRTTSRVNDPTLVTRCKPAEDIVGNSVTLTYSCFAQIGGNKRLVAADRQYQRHILLMQAFNVNGIARRTLLRSRLVYKLGHSLPSLGLLETGMKEIESYRPCSALLTRSECQGTGAHYPHREKEDYARYENSCKP